MKTRRATPADAPQMITLLNDIIAIGGSTAHETPFDVDRMRHHYIAAVDTIACHVVEDGDKILGFQFLGRQDEPMPDGWAIIASFVAPDAAGKGVGQHLFPATRQAAIEAGVTVIDATIRADNVAGLRYYSGLGFADYDRLQDVPLKDGTLVDRVRKRFDLS